MRAFIIRPFGTKNDINFDAVEAQSLWHGEDGESGGTGDMVSKARGRGVTTLVLKTKDIFGL